MIHWVQLGQAKNGRSIEAVQAMKEIAAYDKETYGLEYQHIVQMDGQLGTMGVVVTFDSLAAMEDTWTKLSTDTHRRQLFEKLFEHTVDGSIKTNIFRVV